MLTEEQLKRRLESIGSSDAPIIMGLDPHMTQDDLWLEKIGEVEPRDPEDVTPAQDAGNRFQRAVAEWAQEKLGELRFDVELSAETPLMSIAGGGIQYPCSANLDAVTHGINPGRPVEIKMHGLFGPLPNREAWGLEGTDEIPDAPMVQLHHQMLRTASDVGYLAPFLGGIGFRLYIVPFSPGLAQFMIEACNHFWRCVLTRTRPDMALFNLDTLSRRRRQTGLAVDIPEDLILRYDAAKAAEKEVKRHVDDMEQQVLEAMGTAEYGHTGGALGGVSYKKQTQNRIDSKKLRQHFPDAARECNKTTTFPTLRRTK